MEKLKGKYEVILGFVTLIVSLSAFKDELKLIDLELGYANISLAKYFLYVVFGFAICLYLYILEHIVRETKIGHWKIFDYFIRFAFILFSFILLTPILLIINIVAVKIFTTASQKTLDEIKEFSNVFLAILGILSTIFSIITSTALFRIRKKKLQEEIIEQEIIELDNANKLFNDGYYAQSILEAFKVLETHLFKKLIDKDIRVQRYNQKELIQFSLKHGIISGEDLPAINDIKAMRNSAAHSDTKHTKQQSEFALEFVKQLLKKT